MKIQVSQQMFSGNMAKFEKPMKDQGLCEVNPDLNLGEMIIETDGKEYSGRSC